MWQICPDRLPLIVIESVFMVHEKAGLLSPPLGTCLRPIIVASRRETRRSLPRLYRLEVQQEKRH